MAAGGPELRVRLKSKLLGLEDRDVRDQIFRELQRMLASLKGPQQVEQGLKELFNNINSCNTVARKLRFRSGLFHSADCSALSSDLHSCSDKDLLPVRPYL